MENLEQKRAKNAWDAVKRMKNGSFSDTDRKDYGSAVKKLSMRILTSGLGQALAFLNAKKGDKKGLNQAFSDVSDWITKGRKIPAKMPDNLLDSIVHGDSNFLRRATDESLAYLQWLTRFAEAEDLTDHENE